MRNMKHLKMKNLLLFGILILFSFQSFSQTHEAVNHNLFVQINPNTSEISVTDSISIEGEFKNEFLLNAEFKPVSLSKKISLKKITDNADASDVGMDREDDDVGNALKLTKWKIKGSTNSFVISYHGKIKVAIEQGEENYQRGFSQSPGIIDTLGIYLAGSTFWVPVFEGKLMTFSLTTELPKDWKNVTQGKRTKDEIISGKHIDTWVINHKKKFFLLPPNSTSILII